MDHPSFRKISFVKVCMSGLCKCSPSVFLHRDVGEQKLQVSATVFWKKPLVQLAGQNRVSSPFQKVLEKSGLAPSLRYTCIRCSSGSEEEDRQPHPGSWRESQIKGGRLQVALKPFTPISGSCILYISAFFNCEFMGILYMLLFLNSMFTLFLLSLVFNSCSCCVIHLASCTVQLHCKTLSVLYKP